MANIKNFIHRHTLAKLNFKKGYSNLGITFKEYCEYIYGRISYDTVIYDSKLFGVDIKRIHSYSFVHTLEGIFLEELYKFSSNTDEPYIIDCGSNIGLSIIYFKRLYPNAKVIGFEPDLLIFDACQYNINAFGYKDVELINAAVWKFDGTLKFLSDNSLGGKVIESADDSNNVHSVKSTDIRKYLIKDVDFLKVDIEGAELDVLMHCKEELRKVKNLFVEYHSDSNKPQQLKLLLEIITNAGFRYYIKQAWDYMRNPFVDSQAIKSYVYDLQLNIFAYRPRVGIKDL